MTRDSFLRRGEKKQTKSHLRAPRMERELAARVGGRITPASGARDVKGDVRKKGVLRIEAKTTAHKSFSVTLDMVRKIEEAALSGGETPALIVEFTNDGKPICQVAVVPIYVLDLLGETDGG